MQIMDMEHILLISTLQNSVIYLPQHTVCSHPNQGQEVEPIRSIKLVMGKHLQKCAITVQRLLVMMVFLQKKTDMAI